MNGSRAGFTLLELLAAMTVLALLAMLVGQVFQAGTLTCSAGAGRSLVNLQARAALALLAEELSTALADSNLLFAVEAGAYAPARGGWCEAAVLDGGAVPAKVAFFTLHREPSATARGVCALKYYVKTQGGTNSLMRGLLSNPAGVGALYGQTNWARGVSPVVVGPPLLDHLTAFEVRCDGRPVPYRSTDPQNAHGLPAYADLVLGCLGEADAARARALADAPAEQRQDFILRHERRFVTRVYFLNRQGYARR